MTVAATGQRRGGGYLDRPAPSSLADVIDSILDKGLVIDAYVRVSLVGIELLTIDARIVIASVDTYLRFAEATNRLDLFKESRGLPEVIEDLQQGGARGKTRGILAGAKEAIMGPDEEEEEEEPEERRPRRRPARAPAQRRRRTEEE
jgi:hypothetical protein